MEDDKVYVSNLPVLPTIVTELLSKISDAGIEIEDVVKVIEKDASLSLKILRLANSAFYGLPKHISTIKNAVVILGFNGIRSVVLSINLSKIMKANLPHTDRENNFWTHSLACATVSKKIASKFLNQLHIDPEEAFCAGLLHGVGKFYLSLQYEPQYKILVERAVSENKTFYDLEEEIFGITHNYVGAIIAKVWKFPESLSQIFNETQTSDEFNQLTLLVRLADAKSHELGFHDFVGEKGPVVEPDMLQKLDIEGFDFDQADINDIKKSVSDLKSSL